MTWSAPAPWKMEDYSIDQIIYVIDKIDNQRRKCKIVEIDNDRQKILIHFVQWSKNHDEWLDYNSDRIVSLLDDDSSENESFSEANSDEDLQMREVIGKLLNLSDQSCKNIISTYEIGKKSHFNEKNLSKFNVPMLKRCAETLKIKTESDSGKKFIKTDLIKKIVMRIDALMPGKCSQCTETYKFDLDDISLFKCHMCSRGSHDCRYI